MEATAFVYLVLSQKQKTSFRGQATVACGDGCLYEVRGDPSETKRRELNATATLKTMQAELQRPNASLWRPDRGPPDDAACVAVAANAYTVSPWLP